MKPKATTMKCTRTLLAALLLAPLAALHAAENRPAQPNVIIIMADDLGAADAGCYGAQDIETPAIDALAARGVRFTQFYAASAVCSPSRAGLLTGKYPLHAGLAGNASSERGVAGMPSQPTIAKMLKAAGYATAHIGKWHLGFTPETMPNGQGFDYSFGHMGGCIDNYSHFFYWEGPNRHDLYCNGKEVWYPGRFFPDLMVAEASRFLEQHRNAPFFLYFALNMPHYPYQADVKWLEHYKKLPYPRNLYSAFVATLDERIGELLKKVDELGLRERTIVIFQSDNGHSTELRAHGGGGSAGPYRGAKFSLFEGGMRLPGMISWPGHLPEGAVRSQIVHACDWMPTIAELCGARLPSEALDGRSIVQVIRSAATPSPHAALHWQIGDGPKAQWAVRQGDWKLIGKAWDTSGGDLGKERYPLFLSNLATDVSEKENLADAQPDVVKRLQQLHDDWRNSLKNPVSNLPAHDKDGNER